MSKLLLFLIIFGSTFKREKDDFSHSIIIWFVFVVYKAFVNSIHPCKKENYKSLLIKQCDPLKLTLYLTYKQLNQQFKHESKQIMKLEIIKLRLVISNE